DGVTLGIVAPDGRDGMVQHAQQFVEAGIPFIFDPGQGMPMFDGDDLKTFIEQATYITVNDYEWQLMRDRTGWDFHDIEPMVDALIVTRGAEGSTIYTREGEMHIPAARPAEVRDPTGCGDAYRAGLLFGLQKGLGWETTGRIASLMGAIKIEKAGTQNHSFTPDEFKQRYKDSFGSDLPA
ncbi:MAG: PfkB family carbohydrate kinase, partial [Gammaproteobacteria bacterium]